MNYDCYFLRAIARLRDERRYRVFADLERIAGRYPHAIWHSPAGPRSVVIWCSNDYLAMGQHPKVIDAMVETAIHMGTGAGGTRNIAGTSHPLVELERDWPTCTARRRRSSSPPATSRTRPALQRLPG
jgi:5-aminolevulinate synthase